jgi:hypothetical protein
MPPFEYLGQNMELLSKFVRVGDKFHVGPPNGISHLRLAEIDGIKGQINLIRFNSPLDVDGGLIRISPKDPVLVFGDSDTLQLPVPQFAKEARAKTVEVVKTLVLDRQVEGRI